LGCRRSNLDPYFRTMERVYGKKKAGAREMRRFAEESFTSLAHEVSDSLVLQWAGRLVNSRGASLGDRPAFGRTQGIVCYANSRVALFVSSKGKEKSRAEGKGVEGVFFSIQAGI